MLDDLFYEDNLRAAKDLAQRPPRVSQPEPAFSAWGLVARGPAKGGVAGVSQLIAFQSDVLGAFGGISVASGLGDPMLADRGAVLKEQERIQKEGLSFSSPAGDDLRGFARFLTPDPETAHISERIVFDAARVMTKAVGYVVSTGGAPGALLTGADEGMTAADQLKQQGVDLRTRSAVGAVVGGVTALGVGLPVSGSTVASTVGLGAVGGPLSFMAQQQTVRSILQAQDYTKLAEQYDPLDPVGLAVSTLIPAGFGAWGLRSARARAATEAKAAAEARTDAAAAAEVEAMRTGPRPSGETPVARAVREVTQEQVDAARVWQLSEQRRGTNPFRADDWRAHDQHEEALSRAMDQIAAGERVTVGHLLPELQTSPETLALARELSALQAEREALLPVAADLAERGAIREVRQEMAQMEQQRPDTSEAAARALAKTIQEAEGIGYRPALSRAKDQIAGQMSDFNARLQRLQDSIDSNAKAQQATQRVGEIDQRVKALEAQAGPDAALPLFADRLAAAGRATEALQTAPIEASSAAGPLLAPTRAPWAGREPATASTAAGDPARRSAASAAPLDAAAATARFEQVRVQMPDLMVQLDGMDAPMRVDDLLAAIKAEADDMLADGEHYQQLALCALSHA